MLEKIVGQRLPVLFIGHGTPLNAIADNTFTRGWAMLGARVPRPRAIVVISAHWYTYGTGVTAMERPETIYDFGGGSDLRRVRYPAPGFPDLAEHIAELLAPCPVVRDQSWGFDHGCWSVLVKAYPAADIPVVQVSIDGTQRPQVHYELGRRLSPLRDEGILIFTSGNIVHNLNLVILDDAATPYPWAERFDLAVRDRLMNRNWESLVDYQSLGPDAGLSVPTPEHYLPLVYALGAADPDENVAFPVEGIHLGSVSMRSVVFGKFPELPEPRSGIGLPRSRPAQA
jgi:4,5-DOPA dioxygenase extradiol